MKKLSILLVLAMLAMSMAAPAMAEATVYTQAPMLDPLVESGDLPPVEERVPADPLIVGAGTVIYADYYDNYQIGQYGGTMRSVRNSTTWDGWIWTIFAERGIETVSGEGSDFYANVFKGWEVSDDLSTYTFYMREGMKWSDGEELTTEDVAWKFDMDHANTELTNPWPTWLKTDNTSSGTPCTLEVIDDYTFVITFDGPYPGFILGVASQDVYEMVAPAHYLKDFHIDTADTDELTAKCEANGYSLVEWFKLYELADYSSWDVAAEIQIGSPSLSAFVITKMEGSTATYERNPYYWKVDEAGQQLPYADYMTSTYCVDKEAIAVKLLAGEVDFAYEWVPLSDLGLYAGSTETGDYKLLTKTLLHRTGADLYMNWTFEDANWRSTVAEYDFRAAICYALDYTEIIDSVYFGFAALPEELSITDYDPVKAGELLDGLGMTVGADGWRTYPSGDACVIELAYSSWMTTYEPTAILVADYLRAIGLNISMKYVDNDLMDTLQYANDLQMSIQFSHGPEYVTNTTDYAPYKMAANYYYYWLYSGESGEENTDLFNEWWDVLYSVRKVAVEDIPATHAAQRAFFKDNLLAVMPAQDITQPSLITNRLMNFATEGGYLLDNARAGELCWLAY